MTDGNVAALALLSTFSTLAFIFYLFFTTRNRERLALIDQGVDAGVFNTKSRGISFTLRLAFLAMGVGAGVLFGDMLSTMGMNNEVTMPAMIFFSGGLGLFLAHQLDEKKLNARDKEERLLKKKVD
jgi:hypothetical protein